MYTLKRDPESRRFVVSFVDRDGKRFRKSTRKTDRAEARAVADRWYQRHSDPTYAAADATTVREAADGLMRALVNENKPPATQQFYAQKIGHVCRLFGDGRALSKVDAKLVDAYIETRKGEGAAPSTVAKELVAMRRMLKHARRRGEFDKEISQVMPVSFDPQYVPRTRRIDVETAWRLIAALPKDAGRYVAFTCATSSRDAGARRALGGDYDRERGRILVRDRKTEASTRAVPVVSITKAFADHAFADLKPGAHVFGGTYPGALHALQRACKRMGIEPVTSNDLRRSLAHWLRQAGVPRDIAAEFFAHVDDRMMGQVYGKLDADELADRLNKILPDSWQTPASSKDAVDAADSKTPDKKPGGGGSGGSGRLCNPLPNHLATSPNGEEANAVSENLPASWLDLFLRRRIQELRAEAANDELVVVLVHECVALSGVRTQAAESRLRENLNRLAGLVGGAS